jgi:hypothetical protein
MRGAQTVLWTERRGARNDWSVDRRLDLNSGEQLSFGVSPGGSFDPTGVSTVGKLEFTESACFVSNYTRTSTFAVENVVGGMELVKVPPRQHRMMLPFEISRILIPSRFGVADAKVFGRSPRLLDPTQCVDTTESLVSLDEESKYFAVLVALCEPRLRGHSMAAVPSVQEIVDRISGSKRFADANRSSINYHIDYLVNEKLLVTRLARYIGDGRMHSKREALAAFALRFDLVREEHLSLLPKLQRRSEGSEAVALPTRAEPSRILRPMSPLAARLA